MNDLFEENKVTSYTKVTFHMPLKTAGFHVGTFERSHVKTVQRSNVPACRPGRHSSLFMMVIVGLT